MTVQSVKIKSCRCLFWCGLDEKTETEQYLTVSRTGRVWFKTVGEKTHDNGGILQRSEIILRKLSLSIGGDAAKNMLKAVDEFFEHYLDYAIADDAGDWGMTITYTDGTKKKYWGSMVDDYIPLCQQMRGIIPIDNMWLFDGEEN